jgi:hypothetical protein
MAPFGGIRTQSDRILTTKHQHILHTELVENKTIVRGNNQLLADAT